jgi:hypothetical protein
VWKSCVPQLHYEVWDWGTTRYDGQEEVPSFLFANMSIFSMFYSLVVSIVEVQYQMCMATCKYSKSDRNNLFLTSSQKKTICFLQWFIFHIFYQLNCKLCPCNRLCCWCKMQALQFLSSYIVQRMCVNIIYISSVQ